VAPARPALSSLRGGYRWLVSLDLGGRIVRLSTEGRVTITGTDGQVYEFSGGLVPSNPERALDLWAATPARRSMSFQALLDFDLAELIAQGLPVFSGRGELAQWFEGDPWERRRVVLSGHLEEPAYSEQGEPFAFALVEDPGDDLTVLPAASWVVETGATFLESGSTGPAPAAVGNYYPIVIGSPGQALGVGSTSSALVDEVAAVPALLVKRNPTASTKSDHWIMLCGGFAPATSVRVYNASDPAKTFTTTAILTAYDQLGQPYTYVEPDVGGNSPDEGDAIYTIWDPSTGGGLRSPYSNATLRGAGQVIRWALERSTLRVDESRLSELSLLDAYKIDTYINQPVSPWAWLLAEVLPLLPVTVGTGPEGLFVAPWLASELTAKQAIAGLEEGRNCTRQSGAVYTPASEVYNEITLRFAPNDETGGYALHKTISGDAWDSSDPNTAPAYWLRRSAATFGRRPLSLESSVIYDPATADGILRHLARRYSHPRREIIYRIPRELDWLRPGDVVTLTDAGLHLSSVPAVVGSIAYDSDAISAEIILFDPLVFAG